MKLEEDTRAKLNQIHIDARYPASLGSLPEGPPDSEDAKGFYEHDREVFAQGGSRPAQGCQGLSRRGQKTSFQIFVSSLNKLSGKVPVRTWLLYLPLPKDCTPADPRPLM
jgi:hypothetical protein